MSTTVNKILTIGKKSGFQSIENTTVDYYVALISCVWLHPIEQRDKPAVADINEEEADCKTHKQTHTVRRKQTNHTPTFPTQASNCRRLSEYVHAFARVLVYALAHACIGVSSMCVFLCVCTVCVCVLRGSIRGGVSWEMSRDASNDGGVWMCACIVCVCGSLWVCVCGWQLPSRLITVKP